MTAHWAEINVDGKKKYLQANNPTLADFGSLSDDGMSQNRKANLST